VAVADYDLLVLGDAKPDVIVTGDVDVTLGEGELLVEGATLTLGGSGGIAACGAAALGLRVAFAGAVGDDAFGRFVVDELGARGVDTRGVVVDETHPTGATVVLKGGEREAVLTSIGTVATFGGEQLDRALLGSARHVHVSSYFLQDALRPALPEIFDAARHAGAATSIDPNRDPLGDWDRGLLGLLSSSDVLFANSNEIRELTGVDDIDVAAEALAERGAVVVVKFLQGGGLAIWGDEVIRSEAIPATVTDATGVGASFAAGFIAARLEGWSLDRCLALAVACASLSGRSAGGMGGLPTMDDAVAAIEATA
jgi:sugar/nucleoside kinase (ribokinase family)